MTRYLKKPDAPDWDFHIWTPLLELRGDMEPFTPKEAIPTPGPEGKDPLQGEYGSLNVTPVVAEPSVDVVAAKPVKAAKKQVKGAKRGPARASRIGKTPA